MLTPRYFFHDDFSELAGYFESRPHVRRKIRKGDYLWLPGEPFARIHFILSGVAQNYIEHENGRRRILSFHGAARCSGIPRPGLPHRAVDRHARPAAHCP